MLTLSPTANSDNSCFVFMVRYDWRFNVSVILLVTWANFYYTIRIVTVVIFIITSDLSVRPISVVQ